MEDQIKLENIDSVGFMEPVDVKIEHEDTFKPETTSIPTAEQEFQIKVEKVDGDCGFMDTKSEHDEEFDCKTETDTTTAGATILPSVFKLKLSKDSAFEGRDSIWSSVPIPEGETFGPYKGDIVTTGDSAGSGFAVVLQDNSLSDWIYFLRHSNPGEEYHLELCKEASLVYLKTTRDIPRDTEVLVHHGKVASTSSSSRNPSKPKIANQERQSDSTRNTFLCPICKRRFGGKQTLKNHIMIKHTEQSPNCNKIYRWRFGMRYCIYTRSTEKSYVVKKRQGRHRDTLFFSCTMCEVRFVKAAYLRKHIETHVEKSVNTVKAFPCSMCERSFDTNRSLQRHMTIHRRRFQCSKCDRSFLLKNGLQNHMLTHTKMLAESPFSCPKCPQRFRHRTPWRIHLTTHAGNKMFSCTVCRKYFLSSSNLNAHKRTHTEERPFLCPDCGKCFKNSTYLTVHMRTHIEERPFSCPNCEKCFKHSQTLAAHIRIHTGEKPYACPVCEMCFSQASNLSIHKRIHTGEKPFLCGACNKCFRSSWKLKVHIRTHTGEKPFPCPKCPKSYQLSRDLKNHMRKHLDDKSFDQ